MRRGRSPTGHRCSGHSIVAALRCRRGGIIRRHRYQTPVPRPSPRAGPVLALQNRAEVEWGHRVSIATGNSAPSGIAQTWRSVCVMMMSGGRTETDARQVPCSLSMRGLLDYACAGVAAAGAEHIHQRPADTEGRDQAPAIDNSQFDKHQPHQAAARGFTAKCRAFEMGVARRSGSSGWRDTTR